MVNDDIKLLESVKKELSKTHKDLEANNFDNCAQDFSNIISTISLLKRESDQLYKILLHTRVISSMIDGFIKKIQELKIESETDPNFKKTYIVEIEALKKKTDQFLREMLNDILISLDILSVSDPVRLYSKVKIGLWEICAFQMGRHGNNEDFIKNEPDDKVWKTAWDYVNLYFDAHLCEPDSELGDRGKDIWIWGNSYLFFFYTVTSDWKGRGGNMLFGAIRFGGAEPGKRYDERICEQILKSFVNNPNNIKLFLKTVLKWKNEISSKNKYESEPDPLELAKKLHVIYLKEFSGPESILWKKENIPIHKEP